MSSIEQAHALKVEAALQAEKAIHGGMKADRATKEFRFPTYNALAASIKSNGTWQLSKAEKEILKQTIGVIAREKGVGRGTIAGVLGVSRECVGNWLGGTNTPLGCMLPNLARALGVTEERLLTPIVPKVATPKEGVSSKLCAKWIVENGAELGANNGIYTLTTRDGARAPADISKYVMEHAKEVDFHVRRLAEEKRAEPPKAQAVNGFSITKKVQACGKYARYEYDGARFTVEPILRDYYRPEELAEFGDELNRAAVEMI